MTDTKSEAREFWIELVENIPLISNGTNWMPNGDPFMALQLNRRTNFVSDRPIPNSLHVIEMSVYADLKAKHERVLQALKEASKRSAYEWTDGYDYFPSDHANEGRIALANELLKILGTP